MMWKREEKRGRAQFSRVLVGELAGPVAPSQTKQCTANQKLGLSFIENSELDA